MNNRTFVKLIPIILSFFVFISTLTIVIMGVVFGFHSFEGKFLGGPNAEYLKYFTTLSNVYSGSVALFISIILIKNFHQDIVFKKWAKIIFLSAVTSTSLTFLTVLFFLAPTYYLNGYNFFMMYKNDMFFFHFLNPLLCLFIYLFFFKGDNLKLIEYIYAVIPMIIYTIFYSIFVLTGIWDDFYGFTFGGQYYLVAIVIPVMLLVTYLTALGINILNNFIVTRRKY